MAEPSLLTTVLERERSIWTKSGFLKYEPEVPGSTFELIEERTMLIGPHRLPAAFYLIKPDEALNMKRRASVAKLESTIEKSKTEGKSKMDDGRNVEEKTEESVGELSEAKDSTSSLKEALIKNPSVIQLLNQKQGVGKASVAFRFCKSDEEAYFCLPLMTAVGRLGSSTRLSALIERTVAEESVSREVTVIIKDASQRLHELLQESCKDPMRLSADLPLAQNIQVVYRECCIDFKPPAGLVDAFWPPEISEHSAAAKAKKPKVPKIPAEPKQPKATKPAPSSTSATSNNAILSNKQCAHCGIRGTPQWRRGPGGAGTLCNACGVKWKHGKIAVTGKTTTSNADPVKEEPLEVVKTEPNKTVVIPLKKRKFLQSSYSSTSRVNSTEDVKAEAAESPKESSTGKEVAS